MRKTFFLMLMLLVLVLNQTAHACVGKILNIGIPNSANEQLLAEMIATLVTERTGTTVKIIVYKDERELYKAVKKGEVGVLIENTDHALKMVSRPKESNAKTAYETAKSEYRKSLNMVWLDPLVLAKNAAGSFYYAPVLSLDTLSNLPALPKLINKLSGVLKEDTCAKLLKSVKSDDKPKKVARDFLKSKKLI